jgi:hypothetical protein
MSLRDEGTTLAQGSGDVATATVTLNLISVQTTFNRLYCSQEYSYLDVFVRCLTDIKLWLWTQRRLRNVGFLFRKHFRFYITVQRRPTSVMGKFSLWIFRIFNTAIIKSEPG